MFHLTPSQDIEIYTHIAVLILPHKNNAQVRKNWSNYDALVEFAQMPNCSVWYRKQLDAHILIVEMPYIKQFLEKFRRLNLVFRAIRIRSSSKILKNARRISRKGEAKQVVKVEEECDYDIIEKSELEDLTSETDFEII